MAASIGDSVPDVDVHVMGSSAPERVRSHDLLSVGTVVLFAVPGAFTPGCDQVHLPGFVERAGELMAKGIDLIACISTNDVFVMDAWARSQNLGSTITMVSDGNGDFAVAMGLTFDGSKFGFGTRSKRYAAVIKDGVFTQIDVDERGGVEVSSCQAVLGRV